MYLHGCSLPYKIIKEQHWFCWVWEWADATWCRHLLQASGLQISGALSVWEEVSTNPPPQLEKFPRSSWHTEWKYLSSIEYQVWADANAGLVSCSSYYSFLPEWNPSTTVDILVQGKEHWPGGWESCIQIPPLITCNLLRAWNLISPVFLCAVRRMGFTDLPAWWFRVSWKVRNLLLGGKKMMTTYHILW